MNTYYFSRLLALSDGNIAAGAFYGRPRTFAVLIYNLKNGTLLFILPVSSQLFPNIIIGDLGYNLFPMVEIPGGMIAIGLGDGSINIWST